MGLVKCNYNMFSAKRYPPAPRSRKDTKYRIVAGASAYGWKSADDEQDAVRRWLSEYGYRSLEDAAKEHFCKPSDIKAVRR